MQNFKNNYEFTEIELILKAKQGEVWARNQLIEKNVPLIQKIAQKSIQSTSLSNSDLVQEGIFGLVVAIEKFNPSLGFKFATYATWWIKQAMFKAISEQGHAMKIPVYIQETLSKYKKVKNSLEQKYNCSITPSVVAGKMGMTEDKINLFLNAFTKTLSIENSYSTNEDKELSLAEIIEDTKQNIEVEIESEELKEDIKKALNVLKEKEQNVIILRFGLDDNKKKTLEEIGNIYGVTKECIRQMEKRAIRKIYSDNEIRCRLMNYMV